MTTHTPDGMYKFELGALGALGSGAHGVVRLARHIKTDEMVAVKVRRLAWSMLGLEARADVVFWRGVVLKLPGCPWPRRSAIRSVGGGVWWVVGVRG